MATDEQKRLTKLAAEAAAQAALAADAAEDAQVAAEASKEAAGIVHDLIEEVRGLRRVVEMAYGRSRIWRVAIIALAIVIGAAGTVLRIDVVRSDAQLGRSIAAVCQGRNLTAEVLRELLKDSRHTARQLGYGSPRARRLARYFYRRSLGRLQPIPCPHARAYPDPSPLEPAEKGAAP